MRQPASLLLSVIVLALAAGTGAHAQYSLSILSVDTTNYPNMSAEFVVLDSLGRQVLGLDASDFTLFDDDQRVDSTTITIDCPRPADALPIHAVLVADKSGSMQAPTAFGSSRLAVLKSGATAFVTAVRFVGSTAIALTTFDQFPALELSFTNAPDQLRFAISAIELGEATEYNPALLDGRVGAIPLLRTYPNGGEKRAIIFLTDGQPNHQPDVDSIVRTARAGNIAFYAITIGMPMTSELAGIADATGGQWYGDVQDAERMRAVYTSLALHLQGIEPCHIHWRALPGCGPNSIRRTLTLTLRAPKTVGHARYVLPARSVRTLEVSPAYLWFGPLLPPLATALPVAITARGGTLRVTGADFGGDTNFVVVDWGGSNPPFTLNEGEQRVVRVRFAPVDSSVSSANLTFLNEPCPTAPITVSGGVRGPRFTDVIKLITPQDSMSFSTCDSIPIRWSGVPPTDAVLLEYSNDDGATWKTIATGVTGLYYLWFPPAPGSRYRVRVTSSLAALPDSISTVAGNGGTDADNIKATAAVLSGPANVCLDGDVLYIAESGRHRVRRVDLTSGLITTVAGTGVPGYNGDGGSATLAGLNNPAGITVEKGILYIADYSNHRIRRVDLATGAISTIAGTGGSGFAGDGGPAVNAQLQYPSAVALSDDGLYITDRGNGRVRFINFKTGTINTVAGGGWAAVGDGSRATEVILAGLGGITVARDPTHRNDSLFIADESGHRVRVVEMRNDIISTIAGSGIAGYDGDGKDGRDLRLNKPRNVTLIGSELYISDAGNQRVRVLRRSGGPMFTVTGNGTAAYSGDGGPANLARINGPDGLAGDVGRLVFCDLGNEVVRLISINSDGRSDSSHRAFNVMTGHVAVALPGRAIDFGAMGVGVSRDSLALRAFFNVGPFPLTIDSIEIAGADRGDFMLVSGNTASPLDAGVLMPIEIRFKPTALGPRSAMAIFHGRCATADTLRLNGIGQQPCAFTATDRIDLGDVVLGLPHDSLLVRTICNTGTDALSGRAVLLPADGAFTIVSGGGAFTLAPGECLRITIRFTPSRSGAASALLDYGLPTACGRARTLLVGRGLAPPTAGVSGTLAYPDLPCAPWPRDTDLVVSNTGDAPLVITDVALVANNEGFAITLSPLPSPGAPLVVAPHMSAAIGIRLAPNSTGAKSATLRLSSNDPAGATNIAINGRRDSVGIALSQTALTFNGTLGAPAYPLGGVVVIRNTGTIPLTIGGGSFSGTNADRFDVDAGQLPAVIAPGDSLSLRVRALGPSGDTSLTAHLSLATAPDCGGTADVELIETGSQPAIVMDDVDLRPLKCAGEKARDSVLVVRNPGGAPLVVTNVTIGGANPGAFTVDPPAAFVVPPGGQTSLTVHFTPPASGSYSAQITIACNAVAGDSIVTVTGTMQTVGLAAVPPALALGSFLPNVQGSGVVVVRNTGTATLRLTLQTGAGGFSGGPATPITVLPGDSAAATIYFRSSSSGRHDDTLVVLDLDCGTSLRIPLSATVAASLITTITLPKDTATANARVTLPVTIEVPDALLFAQIGARAYQAKLLFDGRVLVPESATGAAITSATYDDHTGIQRVTLEGTYAGTGDTLFLLHCLTTSGTYTTTTLHFEAFAWEKPNVGADTIPGLFVISGCGPGITLQAHIQALKLRPMPAGEEAVLEFELGEEETVTAVLVDALGRDAMRLTDGRFYAGSHAVPVHLNGLAAGAYTLVVRTPFGSAATQVVVVR